MNSRNRPTRDRLSTARWEYSAVAAALSAVMLASAPLSTLAAAGTADRDAAAPTAMQERHEASGQSPAALRSDRSGGTYKASDLIGREVKNQRGESIGEITDLALAPSEDNVRYAVLSFGGVMGMGNKLFAVPLSAFKGGQQGEDLVLNVSEQQLEKMQGFDDDLWPADVSANWPAAGGAAQSAKASASVSAIVKASEYLGRDVKNLKDEGLGEIQDLAIDLQSGRINYAVIEHGGLMGIGEKLVAVPVSDLSQGADRDEIVLNASEEELENAKGFSDDNWPVAVNSLSDIQYDAGGSKTAGSAGAPAGTASASPQRFGELDSDGNGYLSKSEANREPALDQRYDSLDKNSDGKLDRAEFARFEVLNVEEEQRPAQDSSEGMSQEPVRDKTPAQPGTMQ